MLGTLEGDAAVTTRIVRIRNADTRIGRFAIPDVEIRRCEALANDLQLALIALLHSHPSSPPIISDADRRSLTHCPYHWVIAGFNDVDELNLAGFEAGTGHPVPLMSG